MFRSLLPERAGCSPIFSECLEWRSAFQQTGDTHTELELQFIHHQDVAGIGYNNVERSIFSFERDKIVTEHQIHRNGTEKFMIDFKISSSMNSKR